MPGENWKYRVPDTQSWQHQEGQRRRSAQAIANLPPRELQQRSHTVEGIAGTGGMENKYIALGTAPNPPAPKRENGAEPDTNGNAGTSVDTKATPPVRLTPTPPPLLAKKSAELPSPLPLLSPSRKDGHLMVQLALKDAEAVNELAEEQQEEGWEQRTWVPPCADSAREAATELRFLRGKGSLLDTTMEEVGELGVGVAIYFKLLRTVAIGFTLMSVLALPAMILNRSGTFMDDAGQMDVLQLLSFTLGNHFFWNSTVVLTTGQLGDESMLHDLQAAVDRLQQNREGRGSDGGSQSSDVSVESCPGCVVDEQLLFGMGAYTVLHAALLTVAVDIVYSTAFVFLLWRLRQIIADTVATSRHAVQAANYAVFVRKLPPDATEHQILHHFNDRFDLATELEDRPSRRNSLFRELAANAMRRGSWMLGISAADGPDGSGRRGSGRRGSDRRGSGGGNGGGGIGGGGSSGAGGGAGREDGAGEGLYTRSPSPRRQTLGGGVPAGGVSGEPTSPSSPPGGASISPSGGSDAARGSGGGGGVGGGGEERRSSRRPTPQEVLRRLRQPAPVMDTTLPGDVEYKGTWIAEVSVAHSNGEVLRKYRDAEEMTQRLMGARARAQMYAAGTSYRGGAGADPGRRLAALRRARALEARLAALRGSCRRHGRRDLERELGQMDACTGAFVIFNNRQGQRLCLRSYRGSDSRLGRWRQSRALRFRRPAGPGGSNGGSGGSNCQEWRIAVVEAPNPSNLLWENIGCGDSERAARGLLTQLLTLAALAGCVVSLALVFRATKERRLTIDGVADLSRWLNLPMSPGLLSIVLLNQALKVLLGWLQKFERPVSVTAAERDLSIKMFVAEFINTAICILLAANVPKPDLINYGFQHMAYVSVGSDIMGAVVYIAVLPPLFKLVAGAAVHPAVRRWRHGRVATQRELDALYRGPAFSVSERYPDLLVALFVTLTYCGGMPILLPAAALSFWAFYAIDWYLLLRYHSKPPMYDEDLAKDFTRWLPYALLLHAVGSFIIFSNGQVLPMADAPAQWSGLAIFATAALMPSIHTAVYVACMLPIVVLAFYPGALRSAAKALICCGAFFRGGQCVGCSRAVTVGAGGEEDGEDAGGGGGGGGVLDPIFTGKKLFPSYTGIYFQVVDPNRRLTGGQWELEKELGVTQIENGIVYRVWTDDGLHHGSARHRVGQKRVTWECIAEYSYRITASPRYRVTVALMTLHLNQSLLRLYDAGELSPTRRPMLLAGSGAAATGDGGSGLDGGSDTGEKGGEAADPWKAMGAEHNAEAMLESTLPLDRDELNLDVETGTRRGGSSRRSSDGVGGPGTAAPRRSISERLSGRRRTRVVAGSEEQEDGVAAGDAETGGTFGGGSGGSGSGGGGGGGGGGGNSGGLTSAAGGASASTRRRSAGALSPLPPAREASGARSADGNLLSAPDNDGTLIRGAAFRGRLVPGRCRSSTKHTSAAMAVSGQGAAVSESNSGDDGGEAGHVGSMAGSGSGDGNHGDDGGRRWSVEKHRGLEARDIHQTTMTRRISSTNGQGLPKIGSDGAGSTA